MECIIGTFWLIPIIKSPAYNTIFLMMHKTALTNKYIHTQMCDVRKQYAIY